ncbi:MAG: M50 family metallopeptidase, partial [Candidatus Paceibacterota bacterium]
MFIFDILIFLFILGIVVMVHELGHFLGAKLSRVKVEEFGIGFPPRIWKKQVGETLYVVGATPFGGYNKIYGMDEIDPEKDKDPKSYEAKGPVAKSLICLGGVIMNLLFAVLLFYFLVIGSGFKMSQNMILDNYKFPFGTQEDHPLLVAVDSNSPAEAAGLKPRDVILSINGKTMNTADDLGAEVDANLGKSIQITYYNLDTRVTAETSVIPRTQISATEGPLGVGLGNMSFLEYKTVSDKLLCGFEHTYNFVDYSLRAMGSLIGSSVKERSVEPLANSMTGPVGIFAITKVVSREGLVAIINLVALLSIALGVSNLLPIPAMDGAKFIYVILETINKKVF